MTRSTFGNKTQRTSKDNVGIVKNIDTIMVEAGNVTVCNKYYSVISLYCLNLRRCSTLHSYHYIYHFVTGRLCKNTIVFI